MGKQPVIYRASRQMDPPSKDFVSLEMTQTEIIINLFRIRFTPWVFTDFFLYQIIQSFKFENAIDILWYKNDENSMQ